MFAKHGSRNWTKTFAHERVNFLINVLWSSIPSFTSILYQRLRYHTSLRWKNSWYALFVLVWSSITITTCVLSFTNTFKIHYKKTLVINYILFCLIIHGWDAYQNFSVPPPRHPTETLPKYQHFGPHSKTNHQIHLQRILKGCYNTFLSTS